MAASWIEHFQTKKMMDRRTARRPVLGDNSQQHWKRVVEADENVIIPANEVVDSSLDTWLQLLHSVQFQDDNATPTWTFVGTALTAALTSPPATPQTRPLPKDPPPKTQMRVSSAAPASPASVFMANMPIFTSINKVVPHSASPQLPKAATGNFLGGSFSRLKKPEISSSETIVATSIAQSPTIVATSVASSPGQVRRVASSMDCNFGTSSPDLPPLQDTDLPPVPVVQDKHVAT
jgi:hypothetical protein